MLGLSFSSLVRDIAPIALDKLRPYAALVTHAIVAAEASISSKDGKPLDGLTKLQLATEALGEAFASLGHDAPSHEVIAAEVSAVVDAAKSQGRAADAMSTAMVKAESFTVRPMAEADGARSVAAQAAESVKRQPLLK